MADLQISNLPALAEAGIQATDVLALADLSATETKKVSVKDLVAAAAQFLDAGDIPASKVGSGISAGSLADGSVTNVKLANDSVSFGGVSVDLGAADATPAFNLSDATAYPTSALVGTITNSQLAGSIANAKLANSSVSLGGITVALGASDATPAFDLTDATSYKTINLVGTITNAQLAGSIDVSKLVGSNVNFGGVTVALGGSDTTPAFNLSDATNYPTSALVGTITNAQLAGSIENTKLVANSITANELAANSVTDSELANLSVATGSVQDGAITNDKVQTSTNSTTGLDGATKIRDATITPAKLNTSNLDRSLNVASGNLGINNVITAGTRSGITFNAQGLILSTAALGASDLPLATSSAVGGVSVGTGLSVNGSGVLSLSNSVTGATVSGITFSNSGQITAATALVAGDLPVATTSAKGAVQITSGGGLTVDGSGNLTTSTSGISAGTYQSVTVNTKGVITAGASLTETLIPALPASRITSGSFDAARIANDSIDGTKLSNASTAVFQSIAQSGYPTAQFSGQILFDTVSEDAFIWDGNAWQAITTLTKGSLVFGGTYNAGTSQMVATTSAGIAAGLSVGSNLPTASSTTDGVYVVVSSSGTPSSPAPAIAFAPPDYILGVTNSAGSSWNEVDLSQTVAGQVASNITFTPYGQVSATNVQDAIQELETEKLALAGGTVTGQILIGNTGSLVFEGSTIDAYETTITVADPTSSDKTITFPDTTGTVITSGDTNTVTSTMVDASLVNANLAAGAAIAFSKLAALTSAQIIVGNGSNVPTAVAVTGDIGINNAGLTSITAGAIVNADINASAAIAGSKIATGTTSAVGVLQLTDSTSSTSTTTAATPNAVKSAFDLATTANSTASAALPKAGGTMTDNLIIDNGKELRLSESDSDGANYTGLKAQAQTGDITLTLPAVAPTANQVLKADASTPTTLTWATDAATDSSKMPLAGGTFTGDVTFTGDSSNGLWDKSASAFVANLTGNCSGTSGGFTAGNASNLDSGTVNVARLGSGSSVTTKFLRGDNTWQTVTTTPEGTAILSTGESGGTKFLREDGDGSCSWQAVPSGVSLSGSTNNTIATVTGANALQGEANLTFDGTTLKTVNTDGSAAIALSRTFSGNVASATNTPPLTFTLTDTATSNQVIASISPQGAAGTGDAFNGNMRFYTANDAGTNTERMRITSSGSVGIGTTSPNAALECLGESVRIRQSANSSDGILDFYGQNTSNGAIIRSYGSDGSAGHFYFRNANTTALTIDSAGDVGIGVTDPLLKLHVQDGAVASATTPNSNCDVCIEGTTTTGIQFLADTQIQLRFGSAGSTGDASIIYEHTNDIFRINYSNNGYLSFRDGTGENFRFTPNNEIGIAGANYGTSGQVLTSGGSGAAVSWQDAGGGGGTITAVASGSISGEIAVQLKSDGTVEAIGASGPTYSAGSAVSASGDTAGIDYQFDSVKLTDTKIAVVWSQGGGSGGTIWCAIGDISGTSITFGTKANMGNDQSGWCTTPRVAFGNGIIVVVFYGGYHGREYIRAASYSGNTLSVGTAEYNADYTYAHAIAYGDAGNARFMALWDRSGGTYARMADKNGTNGLSLGSHHDIGVNFDSTGSSMDIGWDTENDHWFIIGESGNDVKVRTCSNSGSSISNVAMTTIATATTAQPLTPRCCYDSDEKQFIVAYHLDNVCQVRVVKLNSSGNISEHTAVTVETSADLTMCCITYNPSKKCAYLTRNDTTNNKVKLDTIDINGTTLSVNTNARKEIETSGANPSSKPQNSVVSIGSDKVVTIVPNAAGNAPLATVRQMPNQSTNLDAEAYIGFSDAAYTNGQTATIKTQGNTKTQSALTPGKKYYVQDDGTVGLSAAPQGGTVVAGTALTSTTLLIRDY